MMKIKSKSDFTEGPLFARMVLYTIPIMLSGLLQMFYNMADHMVLGKFSGDSSALAAVGSTGALTSLIVGLMMGMSAGTAVVVAQFLGAKQNERVSSAVHTSMLFSVIDGIFFMALSFVVCGPILKLMGTKPDIIDEAILYLKIISCGFPAVAVLNFGAGILRSAGDSRTPLVILSLSGLVNVGLNLFFVTVLKMTVEGVALATIISQYVSATAIVTVLKTRQDEPYALCFKKLRIEMRMLMKIMRFGIPAGIQSCLFSLSNVVFMTSINQFDTITITAKTIEGNVDNVTYIAMNSYFHTAMTFTGQNYGARKISRIRRVVIYSLIQVVTLGFLVSTTEYLLAENICALFLGKADPNFAYIISSAADMCRFVLPTYFMCGIMEVLAGTVRAMGYSISSMIIVLLSACGFRIVWFIYLFNKFEVLHTVKGLLLGFPVSWVLSILGLAALFFVVMHRTKRSMGAASPQIKEQN